MIPGCAHGPYRGVACRECMEDDLREERILADIRAARDRVESTVNRVRMPVDDLVDDWLAAWCPPLSPGHDVADALASLAHQPMGVREGVLIVMRQRYPQ
jgi:hypothetical protein